MVCSRHLGAFGEGCDKSWGKRTEKKDERMLKTVEDLGKASRMNFEILFNARGQLVD